MYIDGLNYTLSKYFYLFIQDFPLIFQKERKGGRERGSERGKKERERETGRERGRERDWEREKKKH